MLFNKNSLNNYIVKARKQLILWPRSCRLAAGATRTSRGPPGAGTFVVVYNIYIYIYIYI